MQGYRRFEENYGNLKRLGQWLPLDSNPAPFVYQLREQYLLDQRKEGGGGQTIFELLHCMKVLKQY